MSSAVLVIGIFAAAVCAQDVVKTKPFTEWSKKEAETVLENSPWAVRQELRMHFDQHTQKAAGTYNGNSIGGEQQSLTLVSTDVPVDFLFTLRLRSALPVRQALVRLKQLETPDTGKLNEKDRQAFVAQVKGLLECPACTDNYVITLSSKSANTPGADAVYTTFKGGRILDLKRYIYLANEQGERRELVHFVAPKVPGDEAIFFFPRLDSKGAPLLTTASKDLLVNLSDKQVNSVTNFKIDVSALMLNGKVEF